MGNGLAAGTITAVIVNAAFELGAPRQVGQDDRAQVTGAEG
jgi:xanthine/uracil permease